MKCVVPLEMNIEGKDDDCRAVKTNKSTNTFEQIGPKNLHMFPQSRLNQY